MTTPTTPTEVADAYVNQLADLDPWVSTGLGLFPHDDRMPDYSPAGLSRRAEQARNTLADLDAVQDPAHGADPVQTRCAKLLRDRLQVELDVADAGEDLRPLRIIDSPVQQVRSIFLMMPAKTHDDWAAIARRMSRVPDAYASLIAALEEGRDQGILAAPRQVEATLDQLSTWVAAPDSWWHTFVGAGPPALAADLTGAADASAAAVDELRSYLLTTYLPDAEGTTDPVGADRYLLNSRRWAGADIDPAETYAWGWAEYQRLSAEMQTLADELLPGSTPLEAMLHLNEHGARIDGVAEVQRWLQEMMDHAIADLDGTHFDIAEPIRTVEAMIAPPGSAAAPYYTRPSLDFSRPGRTWLPVLGRTSFSRYSLVSTWYHEGVPGHHLQLAQWIHLVPRLSMFQATIGSSSGATEGWALYAERLMDELDYFTAEERLGHLAAQMMRAIRVVIDIGMHLQLRVPGGSPVGAGQTWTPELALEFLATNSGRPRAYCESEIIRYLGWPGQAISYKLGERVWLDGREAARRNRVTRNEPFDLKQWHMEALSLGALGLKDLEDELAEL